MSEIDDKRLSDARKSAGQLWWGARDGPTSAHPTDEDYTGVAGLFVAEIKARSPVRWDDAKVAWLQKCAVTLAPRITSLWKQKHNRKKPKGDNDNTNASRRSATPSQLSTRSSLPAREAKSNAVPTLCTTTSETLPGVSTGANTRPEIDKESPGVVPRSNLVSKRPRSKGGALQKRVGFEDEMDDIPARHKTSLSTTLVERNIIIKIDGAEFPSPAGIVVGVAAIIADDCYFTASVDIRPAHLSWAKFCSVLTATDAACVIGGDTLYDAEDKMILRYENPRGVGGMKEIKDEADFHVAVDVLDYYAGYAGYSPLLVMRASWD